MLENFLNGLFWGLGLMAAIIATTPIYFLITRFFTRRTTDLLQNLGIDSKPLTQSSGVQIDECQFRPIEDGYEILGTITNSGKDSWIDVEIEIQLLDSSGKLLEMETEELAGIIEPGQTRNFLFESYYEGQPANVTATAVRAENYSESCK